MANIFGDIGNALTGAAGFILGGSPVGPAANIGAGPQAQPSSSTNNSSKPSYAPGMGPLGPVGTDFGPTNFDTPQQPTISANNLSGGAPGGGTGGITTAQNNALSQIEAAYGANVQDLNNQTTNTNQQYALSKEDLGNQYGAAQQNIGNTAAAQADQYDQASNTANSASKSAINQARQAYNELQQKNNSYLSSTGLSNSSVGDALQQSLGSQTLAALNNIGQNRDTTLSNIATQKAQTSKFYNDQIVQLQTGLATAQKQIDLQLNTALDSINNAKNLASNQRQAARDSVTQQAQQAYQSASAQAANYQQALDTWNNTKNQILTLAGQHTTGDLGINDLISGLNSANQSLANGGVQINTAGFLNSLANPNAASAGQSYFVPIQQSQPQILQNSTTGGYQAIDPSTGKPLYSGTVK